MSFTNYVDIDEQGVSRLGCMLCNDTIGTRDFLEKHDGTKVPYLRHWSHIRFVEYYLSDGSFTDLLLCVDCVPKLTEDNHAHLENTMKLGWMLEAVKSRPGYFKEEQIKDRILLTAKNHKDLKIVRRGRIHDLNTRITRQWLHTA